VPDGAWAVIAWICIGAFGVCIVAALAIVLGFWKPPDEDVRKRLLTILFTGVIGSILVGVGVLFARPSSPGAGSNSNEMGANFSHSAANGVSPASPPARPAEATRPQPQENPPVAPSPAARSALEPVPETLRPWAAEHLGERADVDPAFESAYPSCVTDLRARAAEAVAPSEAEDCRRGLSEHHQRYLVPLYAERTRYGRKLTNELAILTRSEITPDNLPLLNFLTRENRNFNYADGQAYQRFRGAERRINADIDLCDTNNCKTRN